MKTLSKHWIYVVLILFFSILGMRALFHPGLFTSHDIWHQVARLYHYYQAINDGQLPPYWISTLANGLGYPLFFFSYHLPWIMGLPFLKVGFDISITLKILFFLAYFSSGLFMYIFANTLLKNRPAALISGILYLWSPYHFFVTLVGASMGVVFVFTFIPLLLLGIHLANQNHKLAIPTIAIGFTGITLSHSMHLFFLAPIIIVFSIWELMISEDKSIFIRKIFFGIIIGILLSSFYLIPAIYYNKSTKVYQETGLTELYKRNFVNLNQIIYSKWGYGPIVNNAKDGEMPVQLGIAQWISAFGLVILLISKKIKKNTRLLSISILSGLIISIILMLDYSLPIWQLIERYIFLDFPFRELLAATFLGSICAGILFLNLKGWLQKMTLLTLVFIALYTNRNHTQVNLYTNIPVSSYIESETTTNSFNEYLPILADDKLISKQLTIAEGNNLKISNIKQTTNKLSFTLDTPVATDISVRQFYFPGQTLYVDDNSFKYKLDQEGRINFKSPVGLHNISVKYEETFVIKVSKNISLVGIILLLSILASEMKLLKK